MDQEITIVTHNGQFHADEVLACGIMKCIYPECIIVRSREEEIINKADIVIDVGKQYSPTNNRFDHHQEQCNEVFAGNYMIPMSSVGMIFKTYGKIFIETEFKNEIVTMTSNMIDELINNTYKMFILEIDAIDNGISNANDKYIINTNLSTTISKMNTKDIFSSQQDQMFVEAMRYAIITFKIHVKCLIDKQLQLVQDYITIDTSMTNRTRYGSTNEILVIETDCTNWLYCIRQCENKNNESGIIKFIIYKSEDKWRVRSMPANKPFENRKNIIALESIKQNDLKNSIVFIHKARFIAGTEDLNSAIKLAQISL